MPRVSWFLLLKFVHVMLAITAVGANITYAIWGARAKRGIPLAVIALFIVFDIVVKPNF